MKGLPAELVYGVLFVVIVLFQYLMRRLAQRAQKDAPQESPAAQSPDETLPDYFASEAEAEPPAATSWSAWGAAPAEPVRRPEPRAAAPTRPGRRFARKTLMGSPRDVQNAIVIATIIGRCRALEPYDTP